MVHNLDMVRHGGQHVRLELGIRTNRLWIDTLCWTTNEEPSQRSRSTSQGVSQRERDFSEADFNDSIIACMIRKLLVPWLPITERFD